MKGSTGAAEPVRLISSKLKVDMIVMKEEAKADEERRENSCLCFSET
jgi:hypothetical protein